MLRQRLFTPLKRVQSGRDMRGEGCKGQHKYTRTTSSPGPKSCSRGRLRRTTPMRRTNNSLRNNCIFGVHFSAGVTSRASPIFIKISHVCGVHFRIECVGENLACHHVAPRSAESLSPSPSPPVILNRFRQRDSPTRSVTKVKQNIY